MKNKTKSFKKALMLLGTSLVLTGCGTNYDMTEKTFFLVMTNIQAYPEEYVDKTISFDSYTYELTSTKNDKYLCVARKCSSGFGCKCGKDTIIGFIVSKDLGLPEPKNQYEDTNDKAWVHVVGQIKSTEVTEFEISGQDNTSETVSFLSLDVTSFNIIEDYSNLNYYVDK